MARIYIYIYIYISSSALKTNTLHGLFICETNVFFKIAGIAGTEILGTSEILRLPDHR